MQESPLFSTPPFASAQEAFLWIQSFYNAEKTGVYDSRIYRLDRMQALLRSFDNPHKIIPCIHIAGSKGKGSTATYIASLLNQLGFKTGLFTSPHLYDYRERITENGNFFCEEIYIQAICEIQKKLPQLLKTQTLQDNPPTVFELITLAAFLIFKKANCDILVIETGLGGRLDATNCIKPFLSVITRIEKEHTEYLGKTLKKIATEKAGIIKKNSKVLIAPQFSLVRSTLKKRARIQNALFFQQKNLSSIKLNKNDSYSFNLYLHGGETSIKLPSPGFFQATNAATAITALLLLKKELQLTESQILKASLRAIPEAPLQGRMQRLLINKTNLYLDGAHTPISFKHAISTFTSIEDKNSVLIFAAVDGKNHEKLIRSIKGNFKKIIVTQAGKFRKNSPEKLYELVQKKCPEAQLIVDTPQALSEALNYAQENHCSILCAGSFFLVSEIGKLTSIV